jgi:hypothetical protein
MGACGGGGSSVTVIIILINNICHSEQVGVTVTL